MKISERLRNLADQMDSPSYFFGRHSDRQALALLVADDSEYFTYHVLGLDEDDGDRKLFDLQFTQLRSLQEKTMMNAAKLDAEAEATDVNQD